ncbi:Scr1 family TA system antitoxin-like transcriptional regulator [Nocardia sp. NPDC058519]|uniref:Scr1 family TA system antitoxin-like transcriptional regulator n=1 Tax=Nocardia sp. NPDC058519 TaxID=3346535 RepID=UPI00364994F7
MLDSLDFPGSRYHWLIGEPALLRTAGSADVMTEQVHALLAAAAKEKTEIGIIPIVDRFVTPIRHFRIWGPEDEEVCVDTEELYGVSVSRRRGDVEHADRSFRLLAAQAVYGNDARAILTRSLSTQHHRLATRHQHPGGTVNHPQPATAQADTPHTRCLFTAAERALPR